MPDYYNFETGYYRDEFVALCKLHEHAFYTSKSAKAQIVHEFSVPAVNLILFEDFATVDNQLFGYSRQFKMWFLLSYNGNLIDNNVGYDLEYILGMYHQTFRYGSYLFAGSFGDWHGFVKCSGYYTALGKEFTENQLKIISEFENIIEMRKAK